MDKKMICALTFEEIAAFYVLNLCTGQDLVDFACKAIENETKSQNLIALAGEIDPILSAITALFERTLNELGIIKPTKLEAQLIVAHHYARAIINGSLTPYEGATEIWWKISNEIENPSDLLLSFVGAASEIEDLPERYEDEAYDPTPLIEEYKKQIVEAARKLINIKDPVELINLN